AGTGTGVGGNGGVPTIGAPGGSAGSFKVSAGNNVQIDNMNNTTSAPFDWQFIGGAGGAGGNGGDGGSAANNGGGLSIAGAHGGSGGSGGLISLTAKNQDILLSITSGGAGPAVHVEQDGGAGGAGGDGGAGGSGDTGNAGTGNGTAGALGANGGTGGTAGSMTFSAPHGFIDLD